MDAPADTMAKQLNEFINDSPIFNLKLQLWVNQPQN